MTRSPKSLSDFQPGAEPPQHAFGVVARGYGLDHGGDAGGVETGEQHGALHLCAGHRQAIFDWYGRADAAFGQGQGGGGKIGPHQAERLGHPAHRAFREAGVACELHGNRMARDKAHEQPRRGARVAHVERRLRLQQAADADAVDRPDRAGLLNCCAHRAPTAAFSGGYSLNSRAHGAPTAAFSGGYSLNSRAHGAQGGGGGHHVLALEQAGNARFAHRQRAEHQRAVADGLVARHTDRAAQRSGGEETPVAHSRRIVWVHGARL